MIDPDTDDERVFKETVTFPGGSTENTYTPSEEFLDLIAEAFDGDAELKVEIVGDEESGNRTITEKEVCFDEEGDYEECD